MGLMPLSSAREQRSQKASILATAIVVTGCIDMALPTMAQPGSNALPRFWKRSYEMMFIRLKTSFSVPWALAKVR